VGFSISICGFWFGVLVLPRLFGRPWMNLGRTVFSQLIDFLPTYQFQLCVERYQGNRYVKDFSCWDQFLGLAFTQLSYRESLRDIEACLRGPAVQAVSHGLSRPSFSQHAGPRQRASRLAHLRRFRAAAHCHGARTIATNLSRWSCRKPCMLWTLPPSIFVFLFSLGENSAATKAR
jgi:hypothetical protein